MKNFFKTVKRNVIFAAILYIVLGLVLAIFPGIINTALCYLIAGACVLYGVFALYAYFSRDPRVSAIGIDFVVGVVAIVAGILLCVHSEAVKAILSLLMSFFVIFIGTLRLQQAIDLLRLHDKSWVSALIFALVVLAVGIVCACLGNMGDTVTRIIGLGLILGGVSDLIYTYRFQKCIDALRGDE